MKKPDTTEFAHRTSPNEELKQIRAYTKKLKADPKQAIAFMASAGICTPEGKLRKAYGGNA